MRILFLLLISFSAFAATYIPIENIGVCPSVKTVFTNQKKCQKHYEKECGKVVPGYNCEIHERVDEMVDDLDAPVYSKTQLNKCGEYCETLYKDLECEDPEAKPILNLDTEEIYCSKLLRYEQIPSGRKIVAVNKAKKAAKEARLAQEKADKEAAKKLKEDRKEALKAIAKDKSKDLSKEEIEELLILLME